MVVKAFFDIDMRLGIDGLTQVMKDNGVALTTENKFVFFLNKKKTHLKILIKQRAIFQLRKPHDEGQITLQEIKSIPKYFSGAFMDHTMQNRIQRHLGKLNIEAVG